MTETMPTPTKRKLLRVPVAAPTHHPFFEVECVGCLAIHRMIVVNGRAEIPHGWGKVWGETPEGKKVGFDYYTSPKCIQRSMARVSRLSGTRLAKCEVEDGRS